MIRKATIAWVCLTNLAFAGIVAEQLAQEHSLYRLLEAKMPWQKYSIPVFIIVVLVVGILLEFLGSRFACFINCGFFLLATIHALDVLAHAGEPEAEMFGWGLGIPAFLVLAIDILLYTLKMRTARVAKAN